MNALLPLLADTTNVKFEWARIQSNADWILPIGVLLAVIVYIIYMYRKDAAELSPWLGGLLTLLRTAVYVGLLVYYLQPQWRIESEKTVNSRAIIAIDTSMSMGLTDNDTVSSETASRIQQVAAALKQSDFIQRLQKTHDVLVVRFDSELHRDFMEFGKLRAESADEAAKPADKSKDDEPAKPELIAKDIDWSKRLTLSGDETRLGQCVQQIISEMANQPLSGLVLISDGGQNAGPGAEVVINAAREIKLPVFTIGVGSDRQPASVRVAAFNPPPRAYPGDPYTITGIVQSWRMQGQSLTVQLLSRPATSAVTNAKDRGMGEVLETQQIVLGADGAEVPVKFQITPSETGKRTLCMKIDAPKEDRDHEDNLLEADIDIVDRKNKVLLFAGGPMYEYQYVRNQLYRDKSTVSDVYLQTGKPGISQECNKLLDEFPSTREELYQYDCIIAFDPDWQDLDAKQIDLLESWVAEQGGGLIVIAGIVNAGNRVGGWIDKPALAKHPALAKILALYPVEFPKRVTALDEIAFKSDEAFPLDFTREGQEADFLTVCDSPVESREAWRSFPGIFGCFPVKGAKQGATVLAHFGAKQGDVEKPVYMAWQFYGSGRVLYLGSGELRRLRAVDPVYFEQLYTKMIRHVSKGRLLRGSTRGVLLVGQERYRLGNTVSVQAYRLSDAKLEPLTLDSVLLQVVQPDQVLQSVTLKADPSRPGSYSGQFTVLKEGDYRLELPLPGGEEERLSQKIRVEIPNLEREHPQRNDALLSELAQKTEKGKAFVGLKAILDSKSGLVELLPNKTKTLTYTATPSPEWYERWLLMLLIGLFFLLCLEWTIRRLAKMA